MICSKCGYEIKDGRNFCIRCGANVSNTDNMKNSVPPPSNANGRIMICSKCGYEIKDGRNFCIRCGSTALNEKVVKNNVPPPKKSADNSSRTYHSTNSNSYQNVNNKTYQNTNSKTYQNANNKTYQNANRGTYQNAGIHHNFFIDSNERQIAVLGSEHLQNFLKNGNLRKGFAILTNKRLYIKGRHYKKSKNFYRRTNEDKIIELKDIAYSGEIQTKNLDSLIAAILFLAFVVIYYVWISNHQFDLARIIRRVFIDKRVAFWKKEEFVVLMYMLVGIVELIEFKFIPLKLFEIQHTGGGIGFNAKKYNKQEFYKFQQVLKAHKR